MAGSLDEINDISPIVYVSHVLLDKYLSTLKSVFAKISIQSTNESVFCIKKDVCLPIPIQIFSDLKMMHRFDDRVPVYYLVRGNTI